MRSLRFTLKLFRSWFLKRDPIFEIYMRNKIVLDLGCGEGKLLKKAPDMIHGIDLNKDMVSKLEQEGMLVKEASVTELPFADQSFDVVHASNIIEHLEPISARKMVEESVRVLRKGGKLVIITPMPKTVWNTFGHIKPYPPASIKKLLRRVSLEAFDPIRGLFIKNVFYYGSWANNKATFLLSTVLAQILPSIFAGSYLMVLEKE